jgi:hypothetical protein
LSISFLCKIPKYLLKVTTCDLEWYTNGSLPCVGLASRQGRASKWCNCIVSWVKFAKVGTSSCWVASTMLTIFLTRLQGLYT